MHCISTIHVFSYSVVKVLVQMPYGIFDLQGRSSGDGEIRTHDPLLARQVLSQLSYTPIYNAGTRLPSRTVSSTVLSAAQVLTIVFGMGTGVTPARIGTSNF